MPATLESRARTRAYARIIGPWLVIVPGAIALRAPEMGTFVSEFFGNSMLVWFSGAMLLFCGLLIIAFHQYWSSAAAVIVSLLGWILALRGLALLIAPQLIESVAEATVGAIALVRFGFGAVILVGLYLTYVGWIATPPAAVAEGSS